MASYFAYFQAVLSVAQTMSFRYQPCLAQSNISAENLLRIVIFLLIHLLTPMMMMTMLLHRYHFVKLPFFQLYLTPFYRFFTKCLEVLEHLTKIPKNELFWFLTRICAFSFNEIILRLFQHRW